MTAHREAGRCGCEPCQNSRNFEYWRLREDHSEAEADAALGSYLTPHELHGRDDGQGRP